MQKCQFAPACVAAAIMFTLRSVLHGQTETEIPGAKCQIGVKSSGDAEQHKSLQESRRNTLVITVLQGISLKCYRELLEMEND